MHAGLQSGNLQHGFFCTPCSLFFFLKKNGFSLNDHLPCLSAELHGKMLPSSGIPSASVSGSWRGPESREGQAKGIQAGV